MQADSEGEEETPAPPSITPPGPQEQEHEEQRQQARQQLAQDPAMLKAALESFYGQHNPGNLRKVDDFMQRYQGREAQLIRDIEEKYNAGLAERAAPLSLAAFAPSSLPTDAAAGVPLPSPPLPPPPSRGGGHRAARASSLGSLSSASSSSPSTTVRPQ